MTFIQTVERRSNCQAAKRSTGTPWNFSTINNHRVGNGQSAKVTFLEWNRRCQSGSDLQRKEGAETTPFYLAGCHQLTPCFCLLQLYNENMLFQHLLPPLRFMVTLGFFIALSLVLYHRIDIIESRLRPWYEENLEVTEYSFNKHVLSSYKTYERKANSE